MKKVAFGALPAHRKVIEVLTVLSTGLVGSRVPKGIAAVAELNLQLFLETTVALTPTVLVSAASTICKNATNRNSPMNEIRFFLLII
jgi:hypothetical protein